MLTLTRFNANLTRHVVNKTQHSALRLAELNFTVEHIPGQSNTWSDMLSRWASERSAPCRRISAFQIPLITEERPELPSTDIIVEAQRKVPPSSSDFREVTLQNGLKGFFNQHDKLYIAPGEEELQLCIFVAAHCGLGAWE